MTDAVDAILGRLTSLGFTEHKGELTPFGERVPLVSAVAWDGLTAQLALIVDDHTETTDDEWRQLLFASSGLRHHLGHDGPAALGTPIVLVVVDETSRARLRRLAEDIAQRYVVFNRVDLNFVLRQDIDDRDRLDDALAPLLPRCREALGTEISQSEVMNFWDTLEDEVIRAAADLHGIFGSLRELVGREVSEDLIGSSREMKLLPPPWPVFSLQLSDFRSFSDQKFGLAPVTVIHGLNGAGKTSVLEALELVWAGASQRKPSSVSAAEYTRHLAHNGVGSFCIRSDDRLVKSVSDEPRAELGRSVLGHEAVSGLVSQSPEDRYAALLTTTGLEIPDLSQRTARLLDEAKGKADSAFRAAGLPPIPRRDSNGVQLLKNALSSDFARRLPRRDELLAAEQMVAIASEGAYEPREWPTEQHAAAALSQADGLISRILGGSPELGAIGPALEEARSKVGALAAQVQARHRSVHALMEALSRFHRDRRPEMDTPGDAEPSTPAPISPALAARWTAHARSVRGASAEFRRAAQEISDADWLARLVEYADALEIAASRAPAEDELLPLTRSRPETKPPVVSEVPLSLYEAAGFTRDTFPYEPTFEALQDLRKQLDAQIRGYEDLDRLIREHPARGYAERSEDVLRALCRFELARCVRREGPIMLASEKLVGELLRGRLAPVVRELVAAIVRFKWYFKPLLIPDSGRKIVLGGLATGDEDLDARLVLNSAERTALGLAWFLALHLLQPADRRRVLVMDDPLSIFDEGNQAGFISTLRAFVRLSRPEQTIVASHDDATATVLADELSPVDDWPTATARLRCQRNPSDLSTVTSEWSDDGRPRRVAEEVSKLGLGDAPPAKSVG